MAIKKLTKPQELEDARIKYQAAISLFTSEGQILWNRFGAMLAINTLLIGFIGIAHNPPKILQIGISVVGIIFCSFWYQMTKRGFMWIKNWIVEANNIEGQIDGQINPVKNGAEFRLKIGSDLTEQISLWMILIIGLIYVLIIVVNLINLINPAILSNILK